MIEIVEALKYAREEMETRGYEDMFMPKRFPAPHGYLPAWCAAATVFCAVRECAVNFRMGQMPDHVGMSAFTIAFKCTMEQMPVYYVTEDFIRAVAATDPPPDMMISDLHWPRKAMVLGFPVKFMREYTGRDISYVCAADLPQGDYRVDFPNTPTITVPGSKIGVMHFSGAEGTRLNTLVSAFPYTEPMGGVFDRWGYTDFSRTMSPDAVKSDQECLNKVTALVMKLLLVLGTKTAFVEDGVCTRPGKIKKGKTQHELWSANVIGRMFVPKRINADQDETKDEIDRMGIELPRSAVRMHWRRGHLRRQAVGPRKDVAPEARQHKVMWIEPVLVGVSP